MLNLFITRTRFFHWMALGLYVGPNSNFSQFTSTSVMALYSAVAAMHFDTMP
jgi:hypothetical protein